MGAGRGGPIGSASERPMNLSANDMVTKGTRRLRDMKYDCNALKTARLRRTPYEWHRVGLRVSDKASEA